MAQYRHRRLWGLAFIAAAGLVLWAWNGGISPCSLFHCPPRTPEGNLIEVIDEHLRSGRRMALACVIESVNSPDEEHEQYVRRSLHHLIETQLPEAFVQRRHFRIIPHGRAVGISGVAGATHLLRVRVVSYRPGGRWAPLHEAVHMRLIEARSVKELGRLDFDEPLVRENILVREVKVHLWFLYLLMETFKPPSLF